MRVRITSDSNWEAKLDHAMKPLALGSVFESRDYGDDLNTLCLVLMCRDEDLKFKRRVRYVRDERKLYLDVMLRLSEFVVASHAERRRMLADALKIDVPEALEKRKFKHFNFSEFKSDLSDAIDQQLLGPEAGRFDSLAR